jgi:hypothetical protein
VASRATRQQHLHSRSAGRVLFVFVEPPPRPTTRRRGPNQTSLGRGGICPEQRWPAQGAYYLRARRVTRIVIRGRPTGATPTGSDTTWMTANNGGQGEERGRPARGFTSRRYPGPINGNAIEDVHSTRLRGRPAGAIAGAVVGHRRDLWVSNWSIVEPEDGTSRGGANRDAATDQLPVQAPGRGAVVTTYELGAVEWRAALRDRSTQRGISGHGKRDEGSWQPHPQHLRAPRSCRTHGQSTATHVDRRENWEVAYNWTNDAPPGGSLVQYQRQRGRSGAATRCRTRGIVAGASWA